MSCVPLLQEKALFEREIKYHTLVHEQLIQFYRCAPQLRFSSQFWPCGLRACPPQQCRRCLQQAPSCRMHLQPGRTHALTLFAAFPLCLLPAAASATVHALWPS
jgi:hypothetical protein